jgi:hypothetical protein
MKNQNEIVLNPWTKLLKSEKVILFESRHNQNCLDKTEQDFRSWQNNQFALFEYLKPMGFKLEINLSQIGSFSNYDLTRLKNFISKWELEKYVLTNGDKREPLTGALIDLEINRRKSIRNLNAVKNRAKRQLLTLGKAHKKVIIELSPSEMLNCFRQNNLVFPHVLNALLENKAKLVESVSQWSFQNDTELNQFLQFLIASNKLTQFKRFFSSQLSEKINKSQNEAALFQSDTDTTENF